MIPIFAGYNNLALLYEQNGYPDKAIEILKKVISLSPRYATAINSLGVILKNKGEKEKSISMFQKAYEIDPFLIDAINNIGSHYRDLGLMDQAIKKFEEALRADKINFIALNNLATTLMEIGKFSDSAEIIRKTISLYPNSPEAYLNLTFLKSFKREDPELRNMMKIYSSNSVEFGDKSIICFALFKAFDDINDIERSFNFLEEANKHRKKALGYEFDQDKSFSRK